jgi:hypothetical protein
MSVNSTNGVAAAAVVNGLYAGSEVALSRVVSLMQVKRAAG